MILEFLVPEKGPSRDKPYPLPQLSLNAQSLRFLDLLVQNTIQIIIENIPLNLPHPANFALHKLIISGRRREKEKSHKDIAEAVKILKTLIDKGETAVINKVFDSISRKYQKKIIKLLEETKELDVLKIFQSSRT